ncbi:oligosaccharide flippase family protein [Microbacterium sp.]|uniref:oligosaccharide flippase family protein n=1 Tax=Microbacterium sp. TaxID=51671 RepID=UPI003F986CCE
MTDELGSRARNAAKWSLITEVIAKIITPVTQLVLARILAPEAFGVLATVIMVASFAEMLADAGFQKYLVQHEFRDKNSLYRSANVAFWSSMSIAVLLLLIIVLLREGIASMVGTPGLGVPIAVAAVSLPMSVFVSTQQALFRRAFEYKKLLPIRVAVAIIPLAVSVPLAHAGFGFWSLIIGVLAANLVNAVAMTVISPWKPGIFFSFPLLKEMFAFSSWSLLEAISIWATVWAGTFIVGSILTPHELGLYRQPILVVNSAFAVITSATTPILFAALSRLQATPDEYRRFFFRFQFSVAVVLFPVGVGAFFYRDFFTDLLFGPKWAEAALMFGAWAFTSSLSIVLSHYCSEIFRSLGRPRVSFLSQCLYMAVMIPALYFAALDGFVTLVIVNAAVRFVAIAISQLLAYLVAGIGFLQVMRNLYAPLLASALMAVAAWWLADLADGHWGWSSLGVLGCAVLYGLACLCFPRTRSLIVDFVASGLKRLRRAS